MARIRPTPPPGKLAGATIALVGQFHWRERGYCADAIAAAGGVVIDPATATPTILLYERRRGVNVPGAVAKLLKRYPTAQHYDLASFYRLLLPDYATLYAELTAPRAGKIWPLWETLDAMLRVAGTPLDLSGADLRNLNLYGAHLEHVVLDRADLSGANLQYARTGLLRHATLDSVQALHISVANVEDCSFREANLEQADFFWGSAIHVVRCDFTGANLRRARMSEWTSPRFTGCTFERADLSGAEMQRTLFEDVDFRQADLTAVEAERAQFVRGNFAGANLARADLTRASLVGADLTGANLSEARLTEADLTGATVTDADFAGAVLSGTILKGVDLATAKNVRPPSNRTPGPHLRALAAAAAHVTTFTTRAAVEVTPGRFGTLYFVGQSGGQSAQFSLDSLGRLAAPSFEQGLLNLADLWPAATPRLDSLRVTSEPADAQLHLADLALAAWAELFGSTLPAAELAAERTRQQAVGVQELQQLLDHLRTTQEPVARCAEFQRRIEFTPLAGRDLHKLNLAEWWLDRALLAGCNFAGASLVEAHLSEAHLRGADFTAAKLDEASLSRADCRGANFLRARLKGAYLDRADCTQANLRRANCTGACLQGANLRGADLTDAVLTDARLQGAEYDPDTKLPAGFKPPADMIWHGTPKKVKKAKVGSLAFTDFLTRLRKIIDAPRLGRATAMLKKETFRLFAEKSDTAVVGVVRSQSDAELVYSCQLANDGAYCCATQNLKPCGGLKGGLCKHLLVLIVGLTKAEQLDAATVATWIEASRSRKAKLEKETLAETFLRYQSAQEGGVDWRPIETVPEDYYAL